jgi:hypothetical protein
MQYQTLVQVYNQQSPKTDNDKNENPGILP